MADRRRWRRDLRPHFLCITLPACGVCHQFAVGKKAQFIGAGRRTRGWSWRECRDYSTIYGRWCDLSLRRYDCDMRANRLRWINCSSSLSPSGWCGSSLAPSLLCDKRSMSPVIFGHCRASYCQTCLAKAHHSSGTTTAGSLEPCKAACRFELDSGFR